MNASAHTLAGPATLGMVLLPSPAYSLLRAEVVIPVMSQTVDARLTWTCGCAEDGHILD